MRPGKFNSLEFLYSPQQKWDGSPRIFTENLKGPQVLLGKTGNRCCCCWRQAARKEVCKSGGEVLTVILMATQITGGHLKDAQVTRQSNGGQRPLWGIDSKSGKLPKFSSAGKMLDYKSHSPSIPSPSSIYFSHYKNFENWVSTWDWNAQDFLKILRETFS